MPDTSPMTLDDLAGALRGMPRDAVMMVRQPDGTLAHIRFVRQKFLAADGRELPTSVSMSVVARYAIVLEVGDG